MTSADDRCEPDCARQCTKKRQRAAAPLGRSVHFFFEQRRRCYNGGPPNIKDTVMPAEAHVEEHGAEVIDPPPAQSSTKPDARMRTKQQPPYAVILHNDHLNGFDFVIGVLRKVFQYGRVKAFTLTMKAHTAGRAAVWSGALEVAELKADQIRSCGPDPNAKPKGAVALRVTLEPLPQ